MGTCVLLKAKSLVGFLSKQDGVGVRFGLLPVAPPVPCGAFLAEVALPLIDVGETCHVQLLCLVAGFLEGQLCLSVACLIAAVIMLP